MTGPQQPGPIPVWRPSKTNADMTDQHQQKETSSTTNADSTDPQHQLQKP